MPETSTEVHHPATVGSTFMRQYYHLLAKEPGSLHRFYKDESTWCHGVGSHMQEAISGQQAINDEILRRGYAGARVDLDIGSIDCQPSLHGGVFVLVTGVMTLASSPRPKPFVQTFFLAVQPKGYFVLNDCLRFLELPPAADAAVAPKDAKKPQAAIGTPVAAASPAAKAATPKKKDTPASPKPVETPVSPIKVKSPAKAASPKAAPAPAPASPVKKAAAPAEPKTTPKPSETKPATPASPAKATAKAPATPASPAVPKAAPAAPAKPAEPAAPPAPKTWAALFAGAPAAAPAAPKIAAVATAAVAAAKPTPASPAKATAEAKEAPKEAPAAPEKEKKRLYSLYIRDVPPQTKESDLRELFKSYGAIASVGVPAGRGIAFVDYREEESMRAALADDKEFKVHDKVLHVEERKDKEQRGGFRADSRGGRGGRGAPKSGRSGDRKDREDGKRPADANGKAPASANGPRAPSGDRREKGGRRSGKEDGGRGKAE